MQPRDVTRFWLPPLLWTGVIFLGSTSSFSSTNTTVWLATLIDAVVRHPIAPNLFDTLHFGLRKAGHLTEYGVLSLLVFRALRADAPLRWQWSWSMAAIAVAAVVGSLDEWHQAFVPSRTSSPIDVLIDTAGATLAQIVIRVRAGAILMR